MKAHKLISPLLVRPFSRYNQFMQINFFDDSQKSPRSRDEVRINQLGVFVYPDGRRLAVGFDITPFIERPSIEVNLYNSRGEPAGSLIVIETLETNFTLTMHLRDHSPTDLYTLEAEIYYLAPNQGRSAVDRYQTSFDITQPGEQIA
jgi:hypothetical protein